MCNSIPISSPIQTSTTTRCPASPRILRCFCNCSELTRDEIEGLINRNVTDLLATPKSRQIFRAFLQLGHTTHQTTAMKRLLCFEKCECLLEQSYPPCEDDVEDLRELCPDYKSEQRLDRALDRDSQADFVEFCEELQYNVKLDIEKDKDFLRFRKALENKLKP